MKYPQQPHNKIKPEPSRTTKHPTFAPHYAEPPLSFSGEVGIRWMSMQISRKTHQKLPGRWLTCFMLNTRWHISKDIQRQNHWEPAQGAQQQTAAQALLEKPSYLAIWCNSELHGWLLLAAPATSQPWTDLASQCPSWATHLLQNHFHRSSTGLVSKHLLQKIQCSSAIATICWFVPLKQPLRADHRTAPSHFSKLLQTSTVFGWSWLRK